MVLFIVIKYVQLSNGNPVYFASLLRFLDHSQWHSTTGMTPLDEESACRIDLYLTTQHSQETGIHVPGKIFFSPCTLSVLGSFSSWSCILPFVFTVHLNTNIHALAGIQTRNPTNRRTHNPRKHSVADSRLWPLVHWDLRWKPLGNVNTKCICDPQILLSCCLYCLINWSAC
jgi:hypothetical protein